MHGGNQMASRADEGGNRDGKRGGVPWRIVGWGGAAVLLSLPLVFQAPWTASDSVFAAVVFSIVGGFLELAVRMSRNPWYRLGALVAVAASFLLVWINGAVGIIGSEDNPANLMFLGVIAIALGGSLIARFRAEGVARAMAAAPVAQALVALPVAVLGLGANEPPGMTGVLVLVGGFTAMWAVSAFLFRKAAR
jgi:hypothetical protein